MANLSLMVMAQSLAVCRLPVQAKVPDWAMQGQFFAVTRTPEELSIVCEQAQVPPEVLYERDWRSLKVLGPLDFSLTGILSAIATPLASAEISIFALSTYDTDYVLIKAEKLDAAVAVLSAAGHTVKSFTSPE
ncbi:MAG: ACT domain-containing protein [Cyanobacteria bacterium J06639_16]